jgi:hypothetical protein
MMAALSHFFPPENLCTYSTSSFFFFCFCHWDVKLCQKKKHYSRVFGLFPVALIFLLLVKFGAKVKVRNSK